MRVISVVAAAPNEDDDAVVGAILDDVEVAATVLCMCFPNEWNTCGTVVVRAGSLVPRLMRKLRGGPDPDPETKAATVNLACGLVQPETRGIEETSGPWQTCTSTQRAQCLLLERDRWH